MTNNLSTKKRLRQSAKELLVGALLAVGLSHGRAAYAHGTAIEVLPTAVEIRATFDDGEPMPNAQVLIYSPSDPETPWQKGETDAEGKYLFAPEAENPGDWEVTVRKAGHGGTTTFAVDNEGVQSITGAGNVADAPAVQKWVSMAAIIWGFVGTALFFSRKASTGSPSPAQTSTQGVGSAASEKVPVSSSPGGQH